MRSDSTGMSAFRDRAPFDRTGTLLGAIPKGWKQPMVATAAAKAPTPEERDPSRRPSSRSRLGVIGSALAVPRSTPPAGGDAASWPHHYPIILASAARPTSKARSKKPDRLGTTSLPSASSSRAGLPKSWRNCVKG